MHAIAQTLELQKNNSELVKKCQEELLRMEAVQQQMMQSARKPATARQCGKAAWTVTARVTSRGTDSMMIRTSGRI
eukprot:2237523-Rhodomonas_salina.1